MVLWSTDELDDEIEESRSHTTTICLRTDCLFVLVLVCCQPMLPNLTRLFFWCDRFALGPAVGPLPNANMPDTIGQTGTTFQLFFFF